MHVVIADFTFPNLKIEESLLESADLSLVGGQCKTPGTLIPLVTDADARIVQFAPITRDVIAAMDRTRVIVQCQISVENVDLVAAKERDIPVGNVPDYCIDKVADPTRAFILATTRKVVLHTRSLQQGKWGLLDSISGMKILRDLTIGNVGFRKIKREVADRLVSFKCRRLVFDQVISADVILKMGCEPTNFSTLLADSDVITLHCP